MATRFTRRLRREFAAAPIEPDAPVPLRPTAGETAESEGYVAALLDLAVRRALTDVQIRHVKREVE